ncbi:hypothetical protein BT63DRAFT_323366 [Microthyrium microscopicum]|uniref:Secreted protein n=1 Tax=Microthyrium microscopicum TaxID=703497 RepID=A0A6A6U3R9_9PEZI|nr:hypothetical protein BT63DRAFT_323366 [Microthyrium microscopicum]
MSTTCIVLCLYLGSFSAKVDQSRKPHQWRQIAHIALARDSQDCDVGSVKCCLSKIKSALWNSIKRTVTCGSGPA